MTDALLAAGDLAAAEDVCAAGLARSRQAGDLQSQAALLTQTADLDLHAGRVEDAAVHPRQALQITARTGSGMELLNDLDYCGHLCAQTRRYAEALTLWAAAARAVTSPGADGGNAPGRRTSVKRGRSAPALDAAGQASLAGESRNSPPAASRRETLMFAHLPRHGPHPRRLAAALTAAVSCGLLAAFAVPCLRRCPGPACRR